MTKLNDPDCVRSICRALDSRAKSKVYRGSCIGQRDLNDKNRLEDQGRTC